MLFDDVIKFVNEHSKEVLEFTIDHTLYDIKLVGWIIHGNFNVDEWKVFYVYNSIDRTVTPDTVIKFMETVYEYYKDSWDFTRIYKALKGDSVLMEEFSIGDKSYRVYKSLDSDQSYTDKYNLCYVLDSKDKKLYSDELNFYTIQKVNNHKKVKYFPLVHDNSLLKHEKAIKKFCKQYLGYVPSWKSILNCNNPDCDKYIRTFRGALGDKFTIKRILPNKCSIKIKGTRDEVLRTYLGEDGFYISSYSGLFKSEYEEILKVLSLLHVTA